VNRRSRDALRDAAPLHECRDCHLPIRFVRIETTGSAMPVNPLTNPKGNVAARIAGGRLVGFVISRDHRPGPLDPLRFMPHHATCEAKARNTSSSTPPPAAADTPLF
jgi:hypothetical protein